jgi:hypothetical protein
MIHLFKLSTVHRKNKIRIRKPTLRPILRYGCETWTMIKAEEMLDLFERKILRRIFFGPTQDEKA